MTLLDQIGETHQRTLRVFGGCHNCPRKLVDFVPATLNGGTVLFVGEAPGENEVREREGFVGRSGQLLRKELKDAGVPEPWSFTNTIHCRPPGNATPKPKEIECCLSQFVLEEVEQYSIIVLVGAVPLQALFPKAKATHFRGNLAHHPDFPGQRFYSIYHPAYLLRRPDLMPQFQKQLRRLGQIVRGEDRQAWTVLRGAEAVNALDGMLDTSRLLSFDLETTGAKSWEIGARIKSFAATADGVTVAALHEDDPQFLPALVKVQAYMEDRRNAIIGQSVAFDVEWMEREFEFKSKCQVHDVGIIWYEAAQYKTPSLKQLVSEQLDGYRWLVHQPHAIRDPELLVTYGAEDVVHAYNLFIKGMQQLDVDTRDLVTRVMGPMSLIYRRASTHGIYIREDYRKRLITEYRERRVAEIGGWKLDDPSFQPKQHLSGAGLSDYLFNIKKLPVITTTEKGSPAVDKAAIKQWVRDGATYLRHLLAIREIDKLLSTYLESYDEFVDPLCRIHPTHWQTGTDTSRPSSSEPNVYNVARKKDIRNMYGAPPGSVLMESDMSQIEFRIMVCLAKDRTGIEGYLRGDDAHTMTARTIAGVETPTKEQRSNAKTVNFALIYGGDWPVVLRVARDIYGLHWTERDCRRFAEAFFATYTSFPAFHTASRTKLIQNRGWFKSITGHVFYYRDWNAPDAKRRDHTARSALNAEAQGPAANLCHYIAVVARRLMDERGFKEAVIVNSVYDSIMTEVPDPSWVPAIARTIDDAAKQVQQWVKPWFVVPLLMEHAATEPGGGWGEMKEVVTR